jgi:hypothetical protein
MRSGLLKRGRIGPRVQPCCSRPNSCTIRLLNFGRNHVTAWSEICQKFVKPVQFHSPLPRETTRDTQRIRGPRAIAKSEQKEHETIARGKRPPSEILETRPPVELELPTDPFILQLIDKP